MVESEVVGRLKCRSKVGFDVSYWDGTSTLAVVLPQHHVDCLLVASAVQVLGHFISVSVFSFLSFSSVCSLWVGGLLELCAATICFLLVFLPPSEVFNIRVDGTRDSLITLVKEF